MSPRPPFRSFLPLALAAAGVFGTARTVSAEESTTASPTGAGSAVSTTTSTNAGLTWDPAYRRVQTPELIFTLAAGALALGTNLAKPLENGWNGGILFDERLRTSLRAESEQGRLNARHASDVGVGVLLAFPYVVDSLVVAYGVRKSGDVALQMALIDVEALALAAALQGTTTFLAGRQRPYVAGCGTVVSADSADCNTKGEYRSFFSGHSTMSFTSAGLVCAHHLQLDLFDSAADVVTCATAFVAAGTVATLRVVGDMHYGSDILVGALVGTTIGLGVPLLHHYRRPAGASGATKGAAGPTLNFIPGPTSVQLVGSF